MDCKTRLAKGQICLGILCQPPKKLNGISVVSENKTHNPSRHSSTFEQQTQQPECACALIDSALSHPHANLLFFLDIQKMCPGVVLLNRMTALVLVFKDLYFSPRGCTNLYPPISVGCLFRFSFFIATKSCRIF